MTNILIIEDEPLAAEKLQNIIESINFPAKIEGKLDAVQSAVEWFQANSEPDLIFSDIQLGDGLSFEIFEQIDIHCPVIFTTAYDEYAIKAFQVNSIDYLLKPITKATVEKALERFQQRTNSNNKPEKLKPKGKDILQLFKGEYKTRFLVKVGEHMKNVKVEDVLWFFTMEKNSFMRINSQKELPLDQSLDQLELLMNPSEFFRVNRKYLIHIDSIQDIISYTNSRLRLKLEGSKDDDIIVSREKVKDFKCWLDR